ncbi:MAG TPA: peptidoglycan DD-metalloendopeptidase family protein [Solirubrobacteraceae bacterium]|nr:peptidoglycan DD-metalloendopeptidase family protein [Solirubrobacteraceae bacterium]
MRPLAKWPITPAVAVLVGALAACMLIFSSSSAGSVESRLAAKRSAENALRQQVATDTSHINRLSGSIGSLEARLAPIQARLDAQRAELVRIQGQLKVARVRLARLEARLASADRALRHLLVARYESDTPDAVTVILNAKGFADLLERLDFIKRVRNQDASIIKGDRLARAVVITEATKLGALESRGQKIAAAILVKRDQLDRVRLELVRRQIAYENARSHKSAKLARARAERQRLEGQLARIHARQNPASVVAPGSISSGGGFTFPLPHSAASSPGSWSLDQGVDISAPGGTPLLAVGSGTIVLHGIGGFGPSAPVLHLDDGRYVYYGHAGPGNMLPIGSHVSAGQTISEVGSGIVGISTGPHLEIGFSDASGTPAPGTASTMMALLHSSYGA